MKLNILKRVIKESNRIKRAKQTGIFKMGEGRKSRKPKTLEETVDKSDIPWASSW